MEFFYRQDMLSLASKSSLLPVPHGLALLTIEDAWQGEILPSSTFKCHDEVTAEILADPCDILAQAVQLRRARQAYSKDLIGY